MEHIPPTKVELEVAGCLRRLFKHQHILRHKNAQWFQNIIEHQRQLQIILNSFFLKLMVNESLGVIYVIEADKEIEEKLAFKIGHKKNLTPFSSILLLQLRHERLQFYLNPEENITPRIKREQLREFLKEFDISEVDSRFEKAFQKALKELCELQVLIETKDSNDFFEISSICDLLLPLDDIQAYRTKIENYYQKQDRNNSEVTQ